VLDGERGQVRVGHEVAAGGAPRAKPHLRMRVLFYPRAFVGSAFTLFPAWLPWRARVARFS
jgi:hypothetical protein